MTVTFLARPVSLSCRFTIAEVRVDQVDLAQDAVRLLLAPGWLHVADPFASLLREYLGCRRHSPNNGCRRWNAIERHSWT